MGREYKNTEDKKNKINIFPHQTIFIDRLYKINKNWLMNFSLEIGPKTDIDTLTKLKDVYITFLPGGDHKETANKAGELVKKGCNPIPHIPARSIENDNHLKEYVDMCKDLGVKQCLVIGGSREPVGKFESSIQLLETGFFDGLKIGIAGHPEGSPDISDSELEKAMQDKKPYAD